MNQFKSFIGFFALCVGIASPAWGRDLQGRLGLGYNAQFVTQRSFDRTPSIALKYGFTKDLAVEGVLGIETGTPGSSVIGLKFFKNVFYETNLNFYFMAAAATVRANSQSGLDFQSGFGTEFFIPGLESVGLSMEVGGELTDISGSYVFKTLGVSFLHAGMRFYF